MSQLKRYQKLGYSDSISKIHRYPSSCKELSVILRHGYPLFPKNLQSLVFQDVLKAFRLLPGMQTRHAVSTARLLYQSVEATLPKQKKNMAVAEYKQAMIALKRRCKTHKDEQGSSELPQDVLMHIFGFLDFRSLASVGLVCWSWSSAASDETLWRVQYDNFFGIFDNPSKIKARRHIVRSLSEEEIGAGTSVDWREAFKRKYHSMLKKISTSNRGYCRSCRTIVWVVNMKCQNAKCLSHLEKHKLVPASLGQVLRYIMDDYVAVINSSEDETDSEEDSPRAIYKYWAIPLPDQHGV